MSSIFDLLVNPEIMEKKEGVGFFFDKPNNLRLGKKKKPTPLGGLARNPCTYVGLIDFVDIIIRGRPNNT